MQVVPRFVSTAPDGAGEAREFLRDYFPGAGQMNSMVFLKGYQWPFDARKIVGGSSIVDILVYIETVVKGRRVFLDYRENPRDFSFAELDQEARVYLEKSKALQRTPLARLRHMNPGAIELYRDHGIDLGREMLEVAVCAQHNNGGLAANHWWESLNIRHLFPVGEVNGSHGVARPGGSALNAGQVGGFRAAEYIGQRYARPTLKMSDFGKAAGAAARSAADFLARCRRSSLDWRAARAELQERMSAAGAHIRAGDALAGAVRAAKAQLDALEARGCMVRNAAEARQALCTLQLCFAHWVYLAATLHHVKSGVGSRGSAMVRDASGQRAHDKLDAAAWSFRPENPAFRELVQETAVVRGKVVNRWVKRRPLPERELWFETAWAEYRKGAIYG
jgi:succinate dehydrogenase/fumarate reductase flavoprotein subunit